MALSTETKLDLASAAFRGQIDASDLVRELDDLIGEIGEIRQAMRFLSSKHLEDEEQATMMRAEGLVYSADLALGMARAHIVNEDEQDDDEE